MEMDSKVTASNCLICMINNPKPKDHYQTLSDQECEQLYMFG